jgi:hypothetical protein
MATAAAYPARVEAELEPRLSRWLVRWLWVILHVVVLSVLWLAYGVLTVVAVFAILFTGRYPRPLFGLLLGLNRWVIRVVAYAGLMTDQYPPFRLDLGGRESGGALPTPPAPQRTE